MLFLPVRPTTDSIEGDVGPRSVLPMVLSKAYMTRDINGSSNECPYRAGRAVCRGKDSSYRQLRVRTLHLARTGSQQKVRRKRGRERGELLAVAKSLGYGQDDDEDGVMEQRSMGVIGDGTPGEGGDSSAYVLVVGPAGRGRGACTGACGVQSVPGGISVYAGADGERGESDGGTHRSPIGSGPAEGGGTLPGVGAQSIRGAAPGAE